jgi:coenzyme F420 hydrogenase subunit beta
MINKILRTNLCAGCGLCQNIVKNTSVLLNEQGFYRPNGNIQKLTKEEVNILSKSCPAVIVKKDKNRAIINDSLWGDIFSCIVGYSSDEIIRSEASSGGAISAFLVYLLESKKVDAVLHIGVSEKQPHINELKISTSRQDVISNSNSRYSPSAPLIDILNNIKDFNNYAFVGKPCDVAALRQYSQFNTEIKSKIKYYIAFFCAGVPSVNATKDIVNAMDIELNDVKQLYYRKDGWPGFFKIVDKKGNVNKLSYSLTWMKLLSPKIQFRCKVCADGIGHLSDIVCADAWESFDNKGFPTFKNAPGKSLIISRTIEGESLLQELLINDYLIEERKITNFREIDKMQPGQWNKKVYYLPRSLALLLKKGVRTKFNIDFYMRASRNSSIIQFFKNFYGTLKRI